MTTGPPLLDPQAARQHLAVLPRPETAQWPTGRLLFRGSGDVALTEREVVELLLELVNEGDLAAAQWAELVGGTRFRDPLRRSGPRYGVSPQRRQALRAFLEERVSIREREATWRRARRRATGLEARRLPHRTFALSLAAEQLPQLLNGRVAKELHFQNAGQPNTLTGTAAKGTRAVRMLLNGPGGDLKINEYFVCDDRETALNLALAITLASSRPFGAELCRCHLPTCRRFWLLSKSNEAGKPVRNYHDPRCRAEGKRLAAANRQSNKRKRDKLRSERRGNKAAKPK